MAETLMHDGRRVSRDKLYALVWQKPMTRLAEEFKVSGNGLAKICGRLNIPYPPRGYWAKKEAGKPVPTFKLPPAKQGMPLTAVIYPTQPKPVLSPEVQKVANTAAGKLEGIVVPDGLDNLHPRVKAWISEHKTLQKERERENRQRRPDTWWRPRLVPDLTERDLYRFRVTSAIFRGVEKAGGKIDKSPISGRITFLCTGHAVECSIVEKLLNSFKDRSETETWTAYPEHHQTGLASSGFLRVSITTYLAGRHHQWIETQKTKAGDFLADVVGTIIAAGPILEQQKLDREEQEKRHREAEARRYELRRQRELDEKRWTKFREFAANHEERRRLMAFLEEVEKRAAESDDVVVADRPLREWIAWARERIEHLDPLSQDVAGMFDVIAKVSYW